MRDWLFRMMFPDQYRRMLYAENRLNALKSEFFRKFASFQRSPLDESQWVSRFTALDADYKALEQEMTELRVANITLRRQLQALTDLRQEIAK